MVTVTVINNLYIGGELYLPGDKLSVTKEKAQDLADNGFIKSITRPVTDKMIRKPKKEK